MEEGSNNNDSSYLAEINSSYEELMKELKDKNERFYSKESSIEYGLDNSSFKKFEDTELNNSNIQTSKIDLEVQEKKGFFSKFFGKKNKKMLDNNSNVESVMSSKRKSTLNLEIPKFPELKTIEKNPSSKINTGNDNDGINQKIHLDIPSKKNQTDVIINNVNDKKENNSKPSNDSFDNLLNEIKSNLDRSKNDFDDKLKSQETELTNVKDSLSQDLNHGKEIDDQLKNLIKDIETIKSDISDYSDSKERIKNIESNMSSFVKKDVIELVNNRINSLDSLKKDLDDLKNKVSEKVDANSDEYQKIKENNFDDLTKRVFNVEEKNNVLETSFQTLVDKDKFDKLKRLVDQINVYVDTFDDRERELEKKYHETKDVMSRLELLEVELNKERKDDSILIEDLTKKVEFVYDYLKKIQNNVYVLSKSVELVKQNNSN